MVKAGKIIFFTMCIIIALYETYCFSKTFFSGFKICPNSLYKVEAFKDGDDIFIEPSTIVPMPVSRFVSVGKSGKENQPWASDGKTWHLEKRCSPKSKEMLLVLDQVLQDEFELEGPRWSQKYYVAYSINNYNWIIVHTESKFLLLDFFR